MKYRYSYSMARKQLDENVMTPLMRTTLVMVVAMWFIVHVHWMFSSSSDVVVFSPTSEPNYVDRNVYPRPQTWQSVTRISGRINSGSSRSISLSEDMNPLQISTEVESRPRKYYSYSTDERLLQDAVEAARLVATPSAAQSKSKRKKKPPKIAFLFLVRGDIPFEPLWRRFFAGHEERYSLYVHTAPNFTFPTSSFFFGKQIPSQRVERLSRSLADAVRRLLAMALVDVGNHNTWFVNLCEATIPLRSFDETYSYLMRSRQSFVQSFQPVAKYSGAVRHFTSHGLRKGEVWMALGRRHAVAVVADRAMYSIFQEQCHKLCSFDERYFQTLLHLRDPDGITNRTVMFVDWSGKKLSSPRTFDVQTTNASLLRRIASLTEDSIYGQHYNTAFQKFETVHCAHNGVPGAPCFLFARKFHPNSLDALLEWFMKESQQGIRFL